MDISHPFPAQVLHHAAYHGRARAISDVLSFVNSYIVGPDNVLGGDAAVRAYCDMRDDTRRTALELALDSGHDDCVQLLLPFTTDGGTKESKGDDPTFTPRALYADEAKADAK